MMKQHNADLSVSNSKALPGVLKTGLILYKLSLTVYIIISIVLC